MSSKVAAQLPLEIVHLTIVGVLPSPAVTPVIVVVGELALVIAPGPETIVHVPVPTAAVLPAIVKVEVLHWLRSIPASATVGVALFVKVTSEVLAVQVPFEIVQRSVTLKPAFNPVTVVVLNVAVVIVAPFAAPTILHRPVPLAGLFAAIVKEPLLHCSWFTPALETVGVE